MQILTSKSVPVAIALLAGAIALAVALGSGMSIPDAVHHATRSYDLALLACRAVRGLRERRTADPYVDVPDSFRRSRGRHRR